LVEAILQEQLKTDVVQASFVKLFKRFCDELLAVEIDIEDSETIAFVEKALCELEFSFQADTCNFDYMECVRAIDKNEIFVNNELLVQFFKSMGGENENMYRYLILVKSIHEIAHLLTPLFLERCHTIKINGTSNRQQKRQKVSTFTPMRIGKKRVKGGSTKARSGDAGYGLEEALLGGRLFHAHLKGSLFNLHSLYVSKFEAGHVNPYESHAVDCEFFKKMIFSSSTSTSSSSSSSSTSSSPLHTAAYFPPPLVTEELDDGSFEADVKFSANVFLGKDTYTNSCVR
jgi:hypothetical protein